MSSLPTSSIPTSSHGRSPESYVCIGPNPNAPDGIIMARFRQSAPHGNETRTGRYRSQMQASHSLNVHCDTTKILGTLQVQLNQTNADLNKNRPLTKTKDRQQFDEDRATWQSALESRIRQLSTDSNDLKLTLVLCLCPSAYAEALSRYAVGPFNKQEHDLLEKFGVLSKNATRAEQIEWMGERGVEREDLAQNSLESPTAPDSSTAEMNTASDRATSQGYHDSRCGRYYDFKTKGTSTASDPGDDVDDYSKNEEGTSLNIGDSRFWESD